VTTGLDSDVAPAGRASRKVRSRTWALVLVGLAAVAALALFVIIPLTPSFTLQNANVQVKRASRVITESFLIENGSMVDQRIAGADLQAAGIRIIQTSAPLTIPSSQHAWVQVTYRVTNCKVAVAVETDAPFPMNLRLERWWGVKTETVQDHGLDYPGPDDVCR
jgi:hypothetical protein